MSEPRNGTLGRWMLGALFTILVLMVSAVASILYDRIVALEISRVSIAIEVNDLKWEVKAARQDICRAEKKIDDLTEFTTKRHVFRVPCP